MIDREAAFFFCVRKHHEAWVPETWKSAGMPFACFGRKVTKPLPRFVMHLFPIEASTKCIACNCPGTKS